MAVSVGGFVGVSVGGSVGALRRWLCVWIVALTHRYRCERLKYHKGPAGVRYKMHLPVTRPLKNNAALNLRAVMNSGNNGIRFAYIFDVPWLAFLCTANVFRAVAPPRPPSRPLL